ncbi:MAG: sulfite exporter TauE/SafE family protein [Magnetovibrio sp.]|nr:sulfite exporter TauE/SafE family protein [Magnetovibrio sp.]
MSELFAFTPLFYAVAIPAVILTGISKSGLGGGMGQLSVPAMAIFISPLAAAAIMLPILCLIDLFNIWAYRKDWHRGNVAVMVPGAVVGIAVGAATYRYVDEHTVRLLLGVIILIFAMSYFVQRAPMATGSARSKALGGFCGALSGFTSFVAHAGGGPMKFYLLPQRLDKRVFVGTHVVFFFLINQIKIWPYLWLGQFSAENLTTSLVLAPLVPLGVWLGWRLNQVLSQALFYRLIYVLLFVSGGKLVWDGMAGLGWIG